MCPSSKQIAAMLIQWVDSSKHAAFECIDQFNTNMLPSQPMYLFRRTHIIAWKTQMLGAVQFRWKSLATGMRASERERTSAVAAAVAAAAVRTVGACARRLQRPSASARPGYAVSVPQSAQQPSCSKNHSC